MPLAQLSVSQEASSVTVQLPLDSTLMRFPTIEADRTSCLSCVILTDVEAVPQVKYTSVMRALLPTLSSMRIVMLELPLPLVWDRVSQEASSTAVQ